jgi:hypothetical protein
MHNAPAVSYPVGRSRFHGCLLALVGLGGAVAGLVWNHQAHPVGWQQWFYVVTLALTCFVAAQVWHRTPKGSLQWDGQAWNWICGQTSKSGALTAHLDLQFCMALSLRTDAGTRIWLWPERWVEAVHWIGLRHAVFSRGAKASVQDSSGKIGLTELT